MPLAYCVANNVNHHQQRDSRIGIPMVTIGMPVYNGGAYLRQAIDSVRAQTFCDYELLISDNASDDDTEMIVRSYCQEDDRIRYVRQTQNIGGHSNFNFVAQNARGEFVTFLAHDDLLEPGFLMQTVSHMSDHPMTVLVASDFAIIDESGKELEVERLVTIREGRSWEVRAAEFFQYPISNVFFCIYGMMRASICQPLFASLSAPRLATGSELPVLARFAVKGEITALPGVLRKYRRHASSMYMAETKAIAGKSALRRLLIATVNVYRLRFDQLQVLWRSRLPLALRCSISVRVALSYLRLFAMRVSKIPKKLGLKPK